MNFNPKSKWLYWIGFFLILALPLLNLPPWFSPPDWGKTIVFRIVLSILIFIFLWQTLFQKNTIFSTIVENMEQRVKRAKIGFWLLVLLLGIFFLATIFSLDPRFSLWGNPYRSGGFLNFAFYIIFAILAFLILEKRDWQKIWDFAIFIGILVSLIAIFQWQGWFEEILIPFEGRPPSTVGGPIFLAIYLLLLSFLILSFGLKEKSKIKKIFYFGSLLLFIFVILLTYTRAAFLGLFVGILYFLFFYPERLILLKISALIFLIFGIYIVYYVNTTTELPKFVQENKFLSGVVQRLSVKAAIEDPRIPGWKVAFEALKDRPILGYGPENFSIGFDRYYDPTLPNIGKIAGGGGLGWWDRAHNFLFDISLQAGIGALIIYLSLFGVLFWQLQKLKNANFHESKHESTRIIGHGIQASFIAYLTANFFSFDVFSTFLISFLMIGYSLSLISQFQKKEQEKENKKFQRSGLWKLKKYKVPILFILFILLVWFIWNFNIKPFQVNAEIKRALYESGNNYCQMALERMEKILPTHTFIDNYLRLQYITVIQNCAYEGVKPPEELAKTATEILKENIKLRPTYTRNWLLLGSYTNVLIEEGEKNLAKEANSYFEKALQLSPRRQEVFVEWIKTDLLTGEYSRAREKSQECIDLNPRPGDCWWLLALSNIYLNETELAQENINTAKQKGYPINSKDSLHQLVAAYSGTENYIELIEVYKKLIKIDPQNPQYHASLAVAYREIGDYKMAKKEALKVLELSPESREEVEEFLQSLEE